VTKQTALDYLTWAVSMGEDISTTLASGAAAEALQCAVAALRKSIPTPLTYVQLHALHPLDAVWIQSALEVDEEGRPLLSIQSAYLTQQAFTQERWCCVETGMFTLYAAPPLLEGDVHITSFSQSKKVMDVTCDWGSTQRE